MAVLTREQILSIQRAPPVCFEMPEWGGEVYLRKMTANEMRKVVQDSGDAKDDFTILSVAVVDPETEKPIFTQADVDTLRNMDAAPVIRLMTEIRRMNRIDGEFPKSLRREFLGDGLLRYVYALAERLHLDEETVLAWDFERLRGWMIYDEITYMLKRASEAAPKASSRDVLAMVRDEQERNGWRGVYREGGVEDDE